MTEVVPAVLVPRHEAVLQVEVALQIEVAMPDCLPGEARCDQFRMELRLVAYVLHHFEDRLRDFKNQIDHVLFLLFAFSAFYLCSLILALLQNPDQWYLFVGLG